MKLIKTLSFIFPVLMMTLTGCASLPPRNTTVSVEGIGSVLAEPDTVQMTLAFNEKGKTTREAQSQVNLKINKVIEILEKGGVEPGKIRTASISFQPEYQWTDNVRTIVGQQAYQSLVFELGKIDEEPSVITSLLDTLSRVDGIQVNQMSFDIGDKTALYSASRELAWQKAYQKASEYAALTGLEVAGVVSISESSNSDYVATGNIMTAAAKGLVYEEASTALPAGEMEITTRISVVFNLK